VTEPYATPEAWLAGPEKLYEALSRAALAEHAADLRGRRVLDLGAGAGATSRAIAALGGHPVGLDASWAMLHAGRRARPPAVAADGRALPLRAGAAGASVAAFVLSHLDDPVALLAEAGRVTTPGGAIVALSFARTGPPPAVQGVVEGLLRARGWVPPPWFRHMKEDLEPAAADPERLVAMARAAGLRSPAVATRHVDTGIDAPGDQVDWRLGSPGIAAFAAAMAAPARRALRDEAVAALGPSPQPLALDVRVLSNRAAAARRSASA
jgi:SAM-dependent methyltransferase